MAKTNEQFDQHFREKLDGHQEKPSMLAWERLESQLPKSSKPALGVWWAVAASVTILLVAGYSFWSNEESIPTETLVAEKTEISIGNAEEKADQSSSEAQEITPETQPEALTPAETPVNNRPKTVARPKSTPEPTLSQTYQNLIAQAEDKPTEQPIVVPVPELKTEELPVTMPELKAPELEKTVAQNTSVADEEPLYRVNIYSNGVTKGEAPEKNLINELGKTVGQVEGFLGKVDNGLIELQDKKDNLFSSLVSKKNQAEARR